MEQEDTPTTPTEQINFSVTEFSSPEQRVPSTPVKKNLQMVPATPEYPHVFHQVLPEDTSPYTEEYSSSDEIPSESEVSGIESLDSYLDSYLDSDELSEEFNQQNFNIQDILSSLTPEERENNRRLAEAIHAQNTQQQDPEN